MAPESCGDLAFAFQKTVSFEHGVHVSQSGINDLRTCISNRPLNYILLVPEDIKSDVEIHLDMRETTYELAGPDLKFYMALVDVRAAAEKL